MKTKALTLTDNLKTLNSKLPQTLSLNLLFFLSYSKLVDCASKIVLG